MLRSYRSFILAIGLGLAGHHPEAVAQPQQEAAQERSAKALEVISARYNEQAKRAERAPESNPCKPGDDQRDSDLCAQWKAADAATDSAWWAGRGTWISGISGLLVIIAIGLAFQSNRIARDTAKRQLRAYMSVGSCEIDALDNDIEFILTARITNVGQTPAYKVRIMGESFGAEYPLQGERPFLPVEDGYDAPVGPSHDICCAYRILTGNNPLAMKHILDGTMGIYIQGICVYEDAFGRVRETKFRYVFGGRIANTGGLVMHAAETGNSST